MNCYRNSICFRFAYVVSNVILITISIKKMVGLSGFGRKNKQQLWQHCSRQMYRA